MRTEKVLTILFLVGLLFKVLHWIGASQILAISLMTIAMLYFPAAFYFFCDKVIKRQNIALSIVSGLFLSLIPLGILFKIMYWRGGQVYLLTGLVTAPIILAVIYFLKSKTADELKTYYRNMFLRTSILTALAFLFYLTPTSTLLEIQYFRDPELARLKTLHYTYPDNYEYKKQHDDYISKRDSMYIYLNKQ
ncbi:MAG: hypothetical protein Q8M15_10820 [Bacteroidota bacterium]|nr:hypothetical protein [Bacteroidota bacterium]